MDGCRKVKVHWLKPKMNDKKQSQFHFLVVLEGFRDNPTYPISNPDEQDLKV